MDASLGQLIDRAGHGDHAAFAQLIRIYERRALAIAYGVLGDASAAGDVTQDAFLRAWQRIGDVSGPERFGGWLGTIVRNLAVDHLRRRPREKPVDQAAMAQIPARSDTQSDRREEINAALATLDELTRAAVVLRYYEGQTSREIAALLDLTTAAVDMRLSRAREHLRTVLSRDRPVSA